MKNLIVLILAALPAIAWAQRIEPATPGQLHATPKVSFSSRMVDDATQSMVTARSGYNAIAHRPSPRQVAQADASLFDGRTIYGCMINSTLWANYSITEVPYGIYSFTMGSDLEPQCHIGNMSYGFKAAAWGRDRCYGVVPLDIMGMLNGARYICLDTSNWIEVSNVMYDTSYGTYSLIPCVMAYDVTDDTFYAFMYKEDLSGLDWAKYNRDENRFEQIATYRGHTMVYALAATPAGEMYYIDASGDLYTLNKTNGRASLVGNTGVTPTAYDQTMVYDGRTGTFLWAAQSTEGSTLYSVDPATAATTKVMNFHNNEQFVTLYSTDSEAPDNAPAAVGRPQLRFATPGSLDATITFTIPSRQYNGATLSGPVNLNVWVDGENIKGIDTEAGTSMTIPLTLSEGNHYICITTDNEAGFSPVRYIYQYAGYDTPKAPVNMLFDIDNGINTLRWSPPAAGVNNGYIDYDALTYNVVRMPDNVVVATGLSDSQFSEPTPADMQSYYYRVYAVNGSHTGDYAESEHVLCGEAFTVPYIQTFEDPATFSDFFTVIDRNGDNNSWRQGYTTEVRIDNLNHDIDADDWLISPPIKLTDGIKYRYTMNMKTFTPNYPETFEIYAGTDVDDLSSFRLIKREENFTEIASAFGDYSCDFMVPAEGEYRMAVRYCSPAGSNSSLIMIRSIGISVVGNALAPSKVDGLVLTPDCDGALKAEVSFTAPKTNLQDESIDALSSIKVYRDSTTEPIHTFENPVPGASLSFTDEAIDAMGFHTYTVVPCNAAGIGEITSIRDFIGIYEAPYSTNFDDQEYAGLWSQENNFEDDVNGWYGWQWTDNPNTYGTHYSLYYYLMEDKPTDIWLFTPRFRLDENTVYTVAYDAVINYSSYPDIEWSLYMGDKANSSSMTRKIGDIPSGDYFMGNREMMLVNSDAGRYFLGFETSGATKYDYFNAAIDNFSLTRRASAFAPFEITGYKSTADPSGDLKATLTFKTPTVNYHNRNLDESEDLTVKIYQGKNATIPVYTTTARPGTHLTWNDEGAVHGYNYYMVTCENQYGRGEVLLDTLYVGRDVPQIVENCTFRATADNSDVVIQWSRPTVGQHGGVIVPDEVKYNIYAYDRALDQLTLIRDGVTGTSYTVEADYTGPQQLHYYAVAAVNTEGEGNALASSVVLGKLYTLPFNESFANTVTSTTLWQMIPMIEQATAWGTDNPTGSVYNGCSGPQDNDGGCLYMYNGSQYENYIGALLVSPKIHLDNAEGNTLTFWTYNFVENYTNPAYVQIAVSADDTNAVAVSTVEVGGTTESGWTKHEISLDAFRSSNFISIVFLGISGGYMDVIYLDNISVTNANSGGIHDVFNTEPDHTLYNLLGVPVNGDVVPGIYIRGNEKVIINR